MLVFTQNLIAGVRLIAQDNQTYIHPGVLHDRFPEIFFYINYNSLNQTYIQSGILYNRYPENIFIYIRIL